MEQTERQLVSLLSEITPLYDVPMREAKARQDALAKPPGSLGLLEDLSVQLAGITGQVKNEVSHTRIYVLAADNGVVCEGVSSAPQSVTRAQAINLTRGLTGASCLAKHFGDELVVADMGIALPYACPEILNRSLGKGTANIGHGAADCRARHSDRHGACRTGKTGRHSNSRRGRNGHRQHDHVQRGCVGSAASGCRTDDRTRRGTVR